MPLNAIPLANIRVTDAFWSRWQRVIADVSIAAQYRQLEQTGRLENFRKAARKEQGGFQGRYFNDSDVYKWLEAAAYSQNHSPKAEIQGMIDSTIDLIASTQEPDGYLNTYFQLMHPHLKFRNLISLHEMYCAGHLFEAAAALHENGDDRLLEVAVKFADHLASTFGPGKRLGFCGHEEVELALIKLSRATANPAYRELARWMIEMRGTRPSPFQKDFEDTEAIGLSPGGSKLFLKDGEYNGEYGQDHLPIREHTQVVGHAVRAMYLYIAASQFGDASILAAIERCWENLTKTRMYITGGIGPSGDNEGFTTDYDLPNHNAYAETCASCGLVFWAQAMVNATGNSEYADIMERALYNGSISGISYAGDRYFYTNPLESRGVEERQEWFDCACCPPNIARLIASVGTYFASSDDESFHLHIPAGFDCTVAIKGVQVKVSVQSDYPWSGQIRIVVDPEEPIEFPLFVRIPAWADEVESDLPGQDSETELVSGYARFSKQWTAGDVLKVNFEMSAKWIEAHPNVIDNLGRVALTRGPLVYCAESQDLGMAPQLLSVDPDIPVSDSKDPGPDGIVWLKATALAEQPASFPDELYAEVGLSESREVAAAFIPYYSWANRGKSHMQVWFRKL